MSKENALDIIKGAILLERQGQSFYQSVARQTISDPVREIFATMALEEGKHVDMLAQHYKSLMKDGKLPAVKFEKIPENISKSILTPKIQKEISAAGFEAAAISAAIAMEDKAIHYYSERAGTTADPLEKELFEWLTNWEKTHLQVLNAIDKELRESVWHDSQFWPVL